MLTELWLFKRVEVKGLKEHTAIMRHCRSEEQNWSDVMAKCCKYCGREWRWYDGIKLQLLHCPLLVYYGLSVHIFLQCTGKVYCLTKAELHAARHHIVIISASHLLLQPQEDSSFKPLLSPPARVNDCPSSALSPHLNSATALSDCFKQKWNVKKESE